MEALARAIEIFKTQVNFAEALGDKPRPVKPQVVNNWITRGRVPAEYCPRIEKATGRMVTCEELRPDVDWEFIRGTEKRAA